MKNLPCILFLFCQAVLAAPLAAQEFVGSEACASCHQEAYSNWQQSHHRQAMAVADADSVLGDFNDTSFDYFGTINRFSLRDGEYFITTDNSEGELEEFRISYTFGFYPLQQYLVEFPDGRLQALSISWDSRPTAEGGQRWFHLYPDQEIDADDPLHWTGVFQNWNSRCASCHTTDLAKNYDRERDTYRTTWAEINVGCEGCHGAGSQHLAWAEGGNPALPNRGLLTNIDKVWEPVAGQLAIPEPADMLSGQLQVCGSCHSRRAELQHRDIAADYFDNFSLTPLQEGLYYPDGQILDEVYVMGSFLQSKMHQNQVSCSNCHEPHSNQLRIEGNGLCLQCHDAGTFQSEAHFFHEAGSEGAQCVNCHMPETTFMGVDARRDHSFRIPDPFSSVALGVPNACTSCHSDQTAAWAAEIITERTGRSEPYYSHAALIASARAGDNAIATQLLALAGDENTAPMLRSIALMESARFPSQRNLGVILNALQSDDALLRASAIPALGFTDIATRFQYLQNLLNDPVKTVRLAAARQLMGLPSAQVPMRLQADFNALMQEYESSQLFNADMPEYMNDLGAFYAARGDLNAAETALLDARSLAPAYLPALINLADVYRAQGRDNDAEPVLNEAMSLYPDSGDVHYALALLLVRTGRTAQAVPLLQRASLLASQNPQYLYVYAVALAETGRVEDAVRVLESGVERFPNFVPMRDALAAYR